MTRVSIAVVGAGAIGRLHAERVARGDAGTRLAAIVDPAEASRDLAGRLGAPWFPDCAALLAAMRPDGAIVATPNQMHVSVSRQLMERGVAVLVEKPIAANLEEADALTAFSLETGVPALVGHHRRHNPIIASARETIASGALGRLVAVTVIACFLKPQDYFAPEWRRRAGAGPILVNLIHEIDLVRFLYGEIVSVQALASNAIRGFEVEDTAAALLRLENGALVTMTLSDTAASPWSWDLSSGELPHYPPQPAPAPAHCIAGTEGSLTLPHLEHWRYAGGADWSQPFSMAARSRGTASPYEAQLAHFVRVVRGEEKPMIDAADGARTLRATLAVHEAAASGRAVALN